MFPTKEKDQLSAPWYLGARYDTANIVWRATLERRGNVQMVKGVAPLLLVRDLAGNGDDEKLDITEESRHAVTAQRHDADRMLIHLLRPRSVWGILYSAIVNASSTAHVNARPICCATHHPSTV
jgi:hypothetical protein